MIRLQTLRTKLILVIFALCGSIGGLFLLAAHSSHDIYHKEVIQYIYRDMAPHLAAERGLLGRPKATMADVQRALNDIARLNHDVDVYLLDMAGRVVASSVPVDRLSSRTVSTDPIRDFLGGQIPFPLLGDDPKEPGQGRVFSAVRLPLDELPNALLYVVLGGIERAAATKSFKRSHASAELSWILGGVLAIAFAAALVSVGLITRPLRRLISSMDRFRSSEFKDTPSLPQETSTTPADDIDRLNHAFVEMARRMVEQMRALRDVDALRREWLANVSHDLKTPLSSLQAHLDALMADGGLSDDERHTYLEIAARQAKGLSRMVARLLDLARLEEGDVAIFPEPFALPDLVQDVLQKFAPSAEARGISLGMEGPEDLPLVVADIVLMERVLDNLLDNALRHTLEGGSIRVGLAPAPGSVMVEVEDNGTGIHPEQLVRIFDRFYRGDSSRTSPGENAGLGLAIVQRILELHGTEITVQSSEGIGTTFRFGIRLAPRTAPDHRLADHPFRLPLRQTLLPASLPE